MIFPKNQLGKLDGGFNDHSRCPDLTPECPPGMRGCRCLAACVSTQQMSGDRSSALDDKWTTPFFAQYVHRSMVHPCLLLTSCRPS